MTNDPANNFFNNGHSVGCCPGSWCGGGNKEEVVQKYSIIYADPPWHQKGGRKIGGYKVVDGKQIFHSEYQKSLDLPYNTMTVEEIAAIPIREVVAKDAFLFMWVTNKYLLKCEPVIKAWGFEYSSCITWKKRRMGGGMGGVVRITSEYLLFCRRVNLKAMDIIPESVIEAKRPYVNGAPRHSKKPPIFREMIEAVSPPLPRLEMFAREQYPGWDVFGDQVANSIILPQRQRILNPQHQA
ncbi:MAG: hypothetical protein J7599_07590 [Niabella sp.]|nr:hypothetical protein [Niabella sp.]